jgi:DNA polymerase-1
VRLHFDQKQFELVQTTKQLSQWAKRCREAKAVCVDTETTGLDVMTVDLVGVALAVCDEESGLIEACYIPIAHSKRAMDGGKFWNIGWAEVRGFLKPVLADPKKPKVLHNALYDMAIFERYGTPLVNVHDSMFMSYSLSAASDTGGHGMDYLAKKYLGHRTIEYDDVVKPELGHENFADVRLDHACAYSAEDTAVTLMLAKVLQAHLRKAGLWHVYNEIDRPMLPALHRMKMNGVRVNTNKLAQLRAEFDDDLKDAERDIYKWAGREFKIGSPAQLAEVLYKDLKLPCWAKTKSGAPSTAKAVLEAMEGEHPVIDAILDYRELAKLIGTYCDTLPNFVHPKTQRVHASTRTTVTRTGRLSMSDPSLHQIPTRARKGKPLRGRQIRDAFEATP